MSVQFYAMRKTLQERWRPTWKGDVVFERLLAGLNQSLAATTKLCAQTEELQASKRYSEHGLTEEIRSFAKANTLPEFDAVSKTICGARAAVALKRQELAVPKPDPSDIAAAIMRMEMRTWLRSLPKMEAAQLLVQDDADERLLTAALEAPPRMAGLTPELVGNIQRHLLEKRNGPELERLDSMEEAAKVVAASIDIGFYELRRQTNFGETNAAAFDAWKQGAPIPAATNTARAA